MRTRLQFWLRWLKVVLTVAILGGVAWFFVRVLQSDELQQTDRSRSPGQILWQAIRDAGPIEMAIADVLYLLGLALCGVFWLLLLRRVGEPLPLLTGMRTYYLSHLGKYAPLGKGWALVLRTVLANQAGVRAGVAALTGAYETLTMMAAGALLAAVLLLTYADGDWKQILTAGGLLALAGIPIIPPIFNRIVRRLAARFNAEHLALRGLGSGTLIAGMLLTGCGWVLLGGSLVFLLQALTGDTSAMDVSDWIRCTTAVAVSWIAGFVLATPGGLGPREVLLQQFLTPHYGARLAVIAAVLLRVLWTAAELLCAAVVYWFPSGKRALTGARSEGLAAAQLQTSNSEVETPSAL